MAVVAKRFSVGTTPVLLTVDSNQDGVFGGWVVIKNKSSLATSVFIGAQGVTSALGYELAAGESVSLTLGPSDYIYAVSTSATTMASLHVFQTGV